MARRSTRNLAEQALGLTRLIVELGVLSSLVFSLALFLAAIAQAYQTIGEAFKNLGEPDTTKNLLIAAVEQADTLLVGVALLMIAFGLQTLFVGRIRNLPTWLQVRSFDDLKQRLLGVVVTALAVRFFAVALEWKSGTDILSYGVAIAAVMLAIGAYSAVLDRLHGPPTDDAQNSDGGGPPDANANS